MSIIREEGPADREAIHEVNNLVFGQAGEAVLIERLRDAEALPISLVAEEDDQIVGHIAFSPARIAGAETIRVLGLGPMAVLPDYQNQGIGSAMVEGGLAVARAMAQDAVIVLGHVPFYPRFGFAPASRYGLSCKFGGGDAFMALELTAGALADCAGLAHYHPAFDEV